MEQELTNSDALYAAAVLKLGQDASPKDLVDDDVACAETVSNLIQKIIPSFPTFTGTWTLWAYLKKDTRFKQMILSEPGCVIISPTGTGNGRLRNGHVGILGKDGIIMSNDSASGLLLENFNLTSWRQKYQAVGGFPVYFFKII